MSRKVLGVFSPSGKRTIGDGSTRKQTTSKTYWFVTQQPNGQFYLQALGTNHLPSTVSKTVEPADFVNSYEPEPEYYEQHALPAMRKKLEDKVNPQVITRRSKRGGDEPEPAEEPLNLDFASSPGEMLKVMEEQAKEIRYTQCTVINTLGTDLRKQNKPDEALEFYEKARTLNPNDDHLLFNIARAQVDLKMFEPAAENLRKALELNPGLKVARLLLDHLERKMGDKVARKSGGNGAKQVSASQQNVAAEKTASSETARKNVNASVAAQAEPQTDAGDDQAEQTTENREEQVRKRAAEAASKSQSKRYTTILEDQRQINSILDETLNFKNKIEFRFKEGYFKNKLTSCLLLSMSNDTVAVEIPSNMRFDKRVIGKGVEFFITKTVGDNKTFYSFESSIQGLERGSDNIIAIVSMPTMMNYYSRRQFLRTSLPPRTIRGFSIWRISNSIALDKENPDLWKQALIMPDEEGGAGPYISNMSAGGLRVSRIPEQLFVENKLRLKQGDKFAMHLRMFDPTSEMVVERWTVVQLQNEFSNKLAKTVDLGLMFIQEGVKIKRYGQIRLDWVAVDKGAGLVGLDDAVFKWHIQLHREAKSREELD